METVAERARGCSCCPGSVLGAVDRKRRFGRMRHSPLRVLCGRLSGVLLLAPLRALRALGLPAIHLRLLQVRPTQPG